MKALVSILAVLFATSAHANTNSTTYNTAIELVNHASILAPLKCVFPELKQGEVNTVCLDEETGGDVQVHFSVGRYTPAAVYSVEVVINYDKDLSLANIEALKKAVAETGLRHFQQDRAGGPATIWTGEFNKGAGETYYPVYRNPRWQNYAGSLRLEIGKRTIRIEIAYVG